MTAAETRIPGLVQPFGAAEPSYLSVERGAWSWFSTHDHKRIGVMFLAVLLLNFMIGGVFAILVRLQLLTPQGAITDYTTYNRFFTLHGIIMIFLFLVPGIPTSLGNFIVPLQLGARDVAFPRLNLASFYVFLAGTVIVLCSLMYGGLDTGWTFYAPYSERSPYAATVPTLVGIFIVGVSSIMTGLNFIVTVHTCRAKDMGWGKIPLFTWSIYATSIIQVLATPVLGMSLVLVAIDAAWNLGIFDPARGGDPIMFQHLFWFYSHPAVYIMILPAMGIVSEVVCTYAHKNPLSYWAIAYSSLGIAFVGFLTWGHHMFVAGMSRFDAGVFAVLSMFVAIFSAIKVFTWTGTLYRGSISFKTPLFYVFAFLFLFVFGGMTGVAVATASLDIHWHDTYFIVAHFHFIMVGGTVTAFLAGLHYWFPKLTGKMYSERFGLLSAALVFMGFFVTFFPQFLLGNYGMPRRYASYPERFQSLNVVSTAGSWVLGAGLVIALVYLAWALRYGRRAGENPWDSASYEWLTSSPPSKHNFDETPALGDGPYAYDRDRQVVASGGIAPPPPPPERLRRLEGMA
jgi:cytochrome c oxidase subunit 1